MDPNGNGNAFSDQSETTPLKKQASNGMRVRDMIRKYDTALKSDSSKTSYSSIISTKSAYFPARAEIPMTDSSSNWFFDSMEANVFDPRRSSATDMTVRPPSTEMQNDTQIAPLEKQKSFLNLSRTRSDPPKAAPREKKPRHSATVLQQPKEPIAAAEASYQSKTTISKTPSGVRIVIDIFFDQNKQLTVQDVVGSRIETDIPPSKILTEFQKRITQSAQN